MLLKNCRIIHWLNMTLENKKKVYFITNIHLTLQICLCPSERIKNVNIIMRPNNTKLTFTKRKINSIR